MILAIDTATRWTGLALLENARGQLLAETGWSAAKTQTIELASRLRQMLMDQHATPADLTAIAVAIGPGSYTGLRIGLGVAKGVALVQQVPLVGVPTLDVTAAGTPLFPEKKLIAVVEAGRKRIIVGRYAAQDGQWRPLLRPDILTWDDLLGSIDTPVLITGELSAEARQNIDQLDSNMVMAAPPAMAVRRAGWLATLGWQRWQRGEVDDASTLTPDYLRQPEGA